MRKWYGTVLIVLALLAVLAGQAGIAAGEERKLAPPLFEVTGSISY